MAKSRATLEEAADADAIMRVVDASHPAWEQQAVVVGEVLHGLGVDGSGPRVVMALNKADLLTSDESSRRIREVEARGWTGRATSALAAGGVESLRAFLGGPVA